MVRGKMSGAEFRALGLLCPEVAQISMRKCPLETQTLYVLQVRYC